MQAIYLPSNNFKKIPTQEQLNIYALAHLSQFIGITDYSEIPHNVRIKNLFDNHIWIYNKINSNSFWIDFGTDSISVADNDGQLGLVSGSSDKFYGHIDVNGKIQVNGLIEEFESLWDAINALQNANKIEHKELIEKINETNLKLRLGNQC